MAIRSRFIPRRLTTLIVTGEKRDEISVFIPLACVFVPSRFRCGIIFHSSQKLRGSALSDEFRFNAPAIHVCAKCSLLHKPLFRIFTYVLRKPISTEPYPTSTLIPRNPVELLNSRTVSHFDGRARNSIFR